MQLSYTVADIIKATGLKRRTVQFWADRGVINATRATQSSGQGVHRSFTRNELIIACVLHPLSLGWRGDQTRSLGELIELAKILRTLLRTPVTHRDFDEAISSDDDVYLIVTWIFGGGIETAIQNTRQQDKVFPGVIGQLAEQSGRSEVLYLNEWLQPLREM
jgi:DNA-binding transcriptional MerR regulator